MATAPVNGRVHVQRLRLRNYRSIRACDVALQSGLTFLVGPNGAGKSNFLDGLRVVADSLNTSLDEAVSARGGLTELRHRSAAVDDGVIIDIRVLAAGEVSDYSIELRSTGRAFESWSERCTVQDEAGRAHSFHLHRGRMLESTEPELPLPLPGRLYLATAANLPVFNGTFEAFRRMRFYNIHPEAMRVPQPPDSAPFLARDGRNMASILHAMAEQAPESKRILEEYLAVTVPGVVEVDWTALGPTFETVTFRQQTDGQTDDFSPLAMSDGTMRALGVLTAAFQTGPANPSLVGIEEPEAALHPRAAAVLRDALAEAGEYRQILVTTHSPELLDSPDIDPLSVLAVETRGGKTVVGPPDHAGLSSIQDGLYTVGELLRINQLEPAVSSE